MKRFFILLVPGLWAQAQETLDHSELIRRNLENIHQDHGVSLALTGMLIVFTGLACISLFIALLPKVLNGIHGLHQKRSKALVSVRNEEVAAAAAMAMARSGRAGDLNPSILAAIVMVIHAEHERHNNENLKVTLGIHAGAPTPWALSSKMRIVPSRM